MQFRAIALALSLAACTRAQSAPRAAPPARETGSVAAPVAPVADEPTGVTQPAAPAPAGLAEATFAGGCFWCLEASFERVNGVRAVLSGYTGGREEHPSYDAVSNHGTSHAEAIRVHFDPAVVTYEQLLDHFWRHIEPTARDRAFVDVGRQYRSVIFAHNPAQRAAAERSKQALAASGRFREPIVTPIEDAPVFWVAEDYHQDFYRTHPDRYHSYHEHSGRREFLRAHWGPDADY
jgi:methionine-S-sulfoxide reductase